jgi:hypothetical protein
MSGSYLEGLQDRLSGRRQQERENGRLREALRQA